MNSRDKADVIILLGLLACLVILMLGSALIDSRCGVG